MSEFLFFIWFLNALSSANFLNVITTTTITDAALQAFAVPSLFRVNKYIHQVLVSARVGVRKVNVYCF